MRYVPGYDERFLFYSHDKTSHAITLDRMGFDFLVIPDHFLTHVKHYKGVWSSKGLNHEIANDVLRLSKQNSLDALRF